MANQSNWRDDPALSCITVYKRRFAILPTLCEGTRIIFRFYYKHYNIWSHGQNGSSKVFDDEQGLHTDFIGNITEETYIIRKLTEDC